jgi:hypothetical protein
MPLVIELPLIQLEDIQMEEDGFTLRFIARGVRELRFNIEKEKNWVLSLYIPPFLPFLPFPFLPSFRFFFFFFLPCLLPSSFFLSSFLPSSLQVPVHQGAHFPG